MRRRPSIELGPAQVAAVNLLLETGFHGPTWDGCARAALDEGLREQLKRAGFALDVQAATARRGRRRRAPARS